MTDKVVFGVSEVAEFVGLKRATLHVYSSRGQLPAPDFVTARQKLWRPATIEAWARANKIGRFGDG